MTGCQCFQVHRLRHNALNGSWCTSTRRTIRTFGGIPGHQGSLEADPMNDRTPDTSDTQLAGPRCDRSGRGSCPLLPRLTIKNYPTPQPVMTNHQSSVGAKLPFSLALLAGTEL